MKKEVNIYAIPGFLGRPSDWNFLHPSPHVIDLFGETLPLRSPWEWAHRFNHDYVQHRNTLNILVGYSLGGRLALHILLDDPTQWDGAVIVSAHPGLSSPEEREQRKAKDADWAHRFAVEPWHHLMEAWNQQDVLKGSQAIPRKEADYSRKRLASSLTMWSLGKQDDLRKSLQKLNLPILWLAGENDPTYSALAKSLTLRHPLSSIKIIPQASHRLPWDQPNLFQGLLNNFTNTLQENAHAHPKHSLA